MVAANLRTTSDPGSSAWATRVESWVFWLAASLLAIVPITFSTAVYRTYSLPRFAVLLIGSSVLSALLLVIAAIAPRSHQPVACNLQLATCNSGHLAILKSRYVVIVSLYLLAVAMSSIFGIAPYVSLLGSFENQMGLITQLCFFVCMIALVVGIGNSPERFRIILWVLAGPGLLTAIYTVAQSAGFDPFVATRLYTYRTGTESVVRAIGAIGHADFLGNFLLYTTPLSVGLGLASSGRARRISLAGAAVSVAAIALSGTRGAWLGLAAGIAVFAVLETRSRLSAPSSRPKIIRAWLLALVAAAALIGFISLGPASHGVVTRAKSFVGEGLTGSGRTVLWRDSLRMVPSYALIGSGPEGFRKAFLPYKSIELARVTGKIQNESSHNSYLDAIISYGIPGAVLYLALIASTLGLLLRVRKLAADRTESVLLTGVVASFVAAIVHKVFIFDLIPTGLYFFAFVAIAISASNLARARAANLQAGAADDSPSSQTDARLKTSALRLKTGSRLKTPDSRLVLTAVCGIGIVGVAVWYSAALLAADREIKRAIESSAASDYEGILRHGESAVAAPDPAGTYHFLFARALADYVAKVRSAAKPATQSGNSGASASAAIDLGVAQAEKTIGRTASPDSAYVLLCYLASAKQDYGALRANAAMALSWDPYYGPAHSFLAEACLAEGDVDRARSEVAAWIDLRRRGKGGNEAQRLKRTQRFLERGSALAEKGRQVKARVELLKASVAAGYACPECHRLVAMAFEGSGLDDMAIEEWERFINLNPARAEAEEAGRRIESLKRKQDPKIDTHTLTPATRRPRR